jgi:hypothetical protein
MIGQEVLMLQLSTEALDTLTRAATALNTFAELVDAGHRKHDWFPTLTTSDPEVQLLADLYDEWQEQHGDPRRAWRGTGPELAVPEVIRKARAAHPLSFFD